ncbi:MAG TPA: hypothetical protein VF796_24390 [Humisphaera sp.]
MTRSSLFDPGSPYVERSGSTFGGADAAQISHMPPDVVDGVVDPGLGGNVSFDGHGDPIAQSSDDELPPDLEAAADPDLSAGTDTIPAADAVVADDPPVAQEPFENPVQ